MTLTALALAWVIVVVLVGLALARAIRLRERQVPVDRDEERADRVRLTETDDLAASGRWDIRRCAVPRNPWKRSHWPDTGRLSVSARCAAAGRARGGTGRSRRG